jgi:hypothetical protein
MIIGYLKETQRAKKLEISKEQNGWINEAGTGRLVYTVTVRRVIVCVCDHDWRQNDFCTRASRQQGVPGSLVPVRGQNVRHDPSAFLSNASQLPGQKSCGTRNYSRHDDKEQRPRHRRVLSGFTCWRWSQVYTTELKRNGVFDFTIMHIAALIRRDLLPQNIQFVYIFSLKFVSSESFALMKSDKRQDIPNVVSVWIGETDWEGRMARVYFQNSCDLIMQTLVQLPLVWVLPSGVVNFECDIFFVNFWCRLMRKVHLCPHGSLC